MQLRAKKGPYYEKWLERYRQATEKRLLKAKQAGQRKRQTR